MVDLSRRSVLAAGLLAGVSGGVSPVVSQNLIPRPEGVMPVHLSSQRAVLLVRSQSMAPFPVVFDTGTNGNALDTAVAKQLGLKKIDGAQHEVVDGSTGKSFVTYAAVLPGVSVGNFAVGDLEVSVYDWNKPGEVGIFGPAMFEDSYVYVDLASARVRVRAKDPFAVPAYGKTDYLNGLPAGEITVPGIGRIVAKLDSGNNAALLLPESFMGKVKLKQPPSVAGSSSSVSGTREVFGGVLDGDVRVGGLVLTGLEVIFSGLYPNVGLPILRRIKVMLDPKAQLSWILDRQNVPAETLSRYVGQYENVALKFSDGALWYERKGRPAHRLHYLGGDLFELGSTGQEIDFRRIDGSIASLSIVTNDYRLAEVRRTG